MADLGLYNFIQNKLGEGETKEQIVSTLLGAGHPQAMIDDAFLSIERGTPPIANKYIKIDLGSRPESTMRAMERTTTVKILTRNAVILVAVSACGWLPLPLAGVSAALVDAGIVVLSVRMLYQARATR